MDVVFWQKVHVLKVGNRLVSFHKAAGCYAWVIDGGLSTGHPSIEDAVGSALQWLRRSKQTPTWHWNGTGWSSSVTMLPYDIGNTGNRQATAVVIASPKIR
jgi:hypothetical protein